MKKFSIFQLGLAIFFFLLAAGGLVAFVTYTGSGGAESANLTIWTDLNDQELWSYVKDNQSVAQQVIVQTYPSDGFVEKVISELSLGKYPDILITSTTNQLQLGQRLKTIPFESLPQSQFTSEYTSGANNLFMNNEATGFSGLPIAIDPLVLYSNSNLLNENGITRPPEFWDEMSQIVNEYAKRNGSSVSQIVLPMGLASNVTNGSEIFYSLLGQINTQPVYYDNGVKQTDLRDKDPARMIDYYTDFANTNSGVYNWNERYESDRQVFVSNDSFFYIDFASQWKQIQSENPNIIIYPSEFPQIRGNGKYVHANYIGAYFPQVATSTALSINLIAELSSQEGFIDALNQAGFVSANRSSIDTRDQNQLISTASKSALYSGSVLIPNRNSARNEFIELINDILARGVDTSRAMQSYATGILEL